MGGDNFPEERSPRKAVTTMRVSSPSDISVRAVRVWYSAGVDSAFGIVKALSQYQQILGMAAALRQPQAGVFQREQSTLANEAR